MMINFVFFYQYLLIMEFSLLTLKYCFSLVKPLVLMMMIMMMMDEVEVLVEKENDELSLKFFSVVEPVMIFEVFSISILLLYLD